MVGLRVLFGETGRQLGILRAGQDAAQALFRGDEVTYLPGDVVGAGHRPDHQVGIGQVADIRVQKAVRSIAAPSG